MVVNCNKEGVGNGQETIVSKANGGVWGNILIGGGVGYIVDRNTGAGFDYPPVITVIMKRIQQAVGIAELPPEKVAKVSE